MRVYHLLIGLVVVGIVAAVALVFGGFLVIREFELFGFKTPEISKKNIGEGVEKALQTASGYTPAKTPAEAMERFRDAILKRKYKYAAQYCSKEYADMLIRAHDAAADLGGVIDTIRTDAKEKNWLSDPVQITLYKLDPFPRNFVIKTPPVQKGDAKAVGGFYWEAIPMKDAKAATDSRFQNMDPRMFNNVLAIPIVATVPAGMEIAKEGAEWKLKVPTTPAWDEGVVYYLEHAKKYREELNNLKIYMVNDRYAADPKSFENDVLKAVTDAKK